MCFKRKLQHENVCLDFYVSTSLTIESNIEKLAKIKKSTNIFTIMNFIEIIRNLMQIFFYISNEIVRFFPYSPK